MKRFYKEVGVDHTPEGFRILLDGQPVKTPGRRNLSLPTQALARAIAEEWRSQGAEIIPTSMPMLRMANTVLDGIRQTRDAVTAAILRFGEHELLCYRAQSPTELVSLQSAQWDPMLEWVSAHYGVRLLTGSGVVHVQQPPDTMARLGEAVAAHDDFALAALHVTASITGSLVLALALAENAINPAQAFQLSRIDETYQAGLWGEDAEAAARARGLAREMDVAADFQAASRA
jgi:chaperone required for assembly of F1-ATPase